MEIQATNILDAYYECMNEVLHKGKEIPPPTSKFSVGQSRYSKEIMNLSVKIINPHFWFIEKCPVRELRTHFPIGLFMWVIFGRNDVDFIKHYNPKGASFCEEDGSFYGAYGPRIENQMRDAVDNLKRDKNSRRSMVVIFKPGDILYESKDIPCVCSFHFLIRNNRLHMTTHMRSQSITMIFPYDVGAFCAIQQMVATMVGVEVGVYHHFCSSAHIYENELEFTKKILDAKVGTSYVRKFNMLPKDFQTDTLKSVEKAEAMYRVANGKVDLESYIPKQGFWNEVGKEMGWI